MRILVHTQYYPPEMGAPQARLSDLAGRLRDRGHHVEVLTALPNYPTGRIFKGYSGIYQRRMRDGIPVHHCWIVPSNRPGFAHRLLSYLSFCLSSLGIGAVRVGRMDIVLTETPPLFLGVAGWVLSKLKGARWVLNVSDLWPESARSIGMMEESSVTYRALLWLARFLYRKAWLITGQSEGIVSKIQAQVSAARTHHLSNGVDPGLFHPSQRRDDVRRRYVKNGEIGFVYAGLHGLFQGLDQVLDAADRLREEPVQFVLFGDGPEKRGLIRKARDLGLQNLAFHPPIAHSRMPAVLASMDVALITLKSWILGAVPSKIYEAMSSGLPILLVADGEAKTIVEKTRSGLALPPGDIEGMVKGIKELASKPELRARLGMAGRRAAVELYDRRKIAENFMEILSAGIGRHENSSCSPERTTTKR